MRNWVLQSIVLLTLCSTAFSFEEPEFEMTPGMELEQKMITERLKLKSGKVVLRTHDFHTESLNDEHERFQEDHRTIYEFDMENLRREMLNQQIKGCTHSAVMIITPQESIHATSDYNTTFIRQASRSGSASQRGFYWHPNELGIYIFSSALISQSTDSSGKKEISSRGYTRHFDRVNEHVTDELLDGTPVKHISYDLPNGDHLEYWIAPTQAYSLLKVVDKSERMKIGIKVIRKITYDIQWKQYHLGVWYPLRLNHLVKDGNVITIDSETVVEKADFKTPVSPERFTSQSIIDVAKTVRFIDQSIRYTDQGLKTEQEYQDYLINLGGSPPSLEEGTSNYRGKIFVAIILTLLAFVLIRQRK